MLLSFVIPPISSTLEFVCENLIMKKVDQHFGNVISINMGAHHQSMQQFSFSERVIFMPILEELIFRVGLEPLAAYCFSKLSIPRANLISSIAVSVLFGALHYTKDNKQVAIIQASFAVLASLHFSLLNYQFGIQASALSHITFNFLCYYFPYKIL